MKTLTILTTVIVLFFTSGLFAQSQYELNTTPGQKIEVENLLGKIIVENHSGNQLVIKVDKYGKLPDKAKGLKEIYNGATDNTGIGIAIKVNGKSIFVQGASKRTEEGTYTFLVPENVNMKIDYSSPFGYESIKVNSFSGEFEAKTLNENIELNKVTGPINIHTINGNIVADFVSLSQNAPTALTSINGDVEVKVPASSKATIDFGTMHGEIYTDCDIEMEKKKDTKSDEWVMIGGHSNNTGKLNGGGVELKLSTINGSIYLRKK